jgi:hypothetical protein
MELAHLTGRPFAEILGLPARDLATLVDIIDEEQAARRRARGG